MRNSRFSALALAVTLMLLSALPAAAAEGDNWLVPKVKDAPAFSDTAGAWCEAEVSTVYEAGLMEGRSAERFDVTAPLTNAQIAVITARLHSLLSGGDGILPAASPDEAWYQPALRDPKETCQDEDVLSFLKQFSLFPEEFPDAPCTRRNFAVTLTGVLPEPLPAINTMARVPDSTEVKVQTLYSAGILTGNDNYGTFDGDGTVNRGQAAAILARLVDPALRRTVTLTSFDLCADVLGLEADTVLLTVGGEAVTAELFACQLCTSLYQQGGSRQALNDAIYAWCFFDAPFQVLAEEQGVALTAEEQAQAEQYGRDTAGYLGLSAAYWQHQQTRVLLNNRMTMLYWEKDWKTGEASYHSDLEDISETLLESAALSDAMNGLDLEAVYNRLTNSPFLLWNF